MLCRPPYRGRNDDLRWFVPLGPGLGAAGAGEYAEVDLGRPALPASLLAIRRSAAIAIPSPPPAVWPWSTLVLVRAGRRETEPRLGAASHGILLPAQ
jgi:hypothetical protein